MISKAYDGFRTYEAPETRLWCTEGADSDLVLQPRHSGAQQAAEPECLICGQWDALSTDINKCGPYCMRRHVGRARA